MRLSFSILLRSTLAACVVSLATGAGTLSAGAQLTGQNKPVGSADQAPTIKVTRRLIIETVGVKDKKGSPIGRTSRSPKTACRRRSATANTRC